jgi:hypothetical protein
VKALEATEPKIARTLLFCHNKSLPKRLLSPFKVSSKKKFYDIFINNFNNVIDLFRCEKEKCSPILIKPPEPASSHDFNGLLFFESVLTFHFSVSGFAHIRKGPEDSPEL